MRRKVAVRQVIERVKDEGLPQNESTKLLALEDEVPFTCLESSGEVDLEPTFLILEDDVEMLGDVAVEEGSHRPPTFLTKFLREAGSQPENSDYVQCFRYDSCERLRQQKPARPVAAVRNQILRRNKGNSCITSPATGTSKDRVRCTA